MHDGYKEVADSRETRHCRDRIASNASNARQGASRAQEVAWLHKSARVDGAEEGIKSNNDLQVVVPKDENGRGSLAAGGRTHRTDGTPTTRARIHAM